MAHRIVWSQTSQRDLHSLVKTISRDSPQRAEQFGYRIVARVEMLQEYPRMGRVVPEFNQPDLHEVTVRPYRIIYRRKDKRPRSPALTRNALPAKRAIASRRKLDAGEG